MDDPVAAMLGGRPDLLAAWDQDLAAARDDDPAWCRSARLLVESLRPVPSPEPGLFWVRAEGLVAATAAVAAALDGDQP